MSFPHAKVRPVDIFRCVNERSKLTRFQRLILTHPMWRKAPRRAALI